jgi:hypothetical protein
MVGAAGLILGLAFSGSFVAVIATGEAHAGSAYPSQWFDDARLRAVPAATQAVESPTTVALRFFEALPSRDVYAALRAVRPPAIPADERAQLIATLPEEGELEPDAAERHKLAALAPVLLYHERDRVLDVKVIDLPHAGLVIYHRAVLLVTRPALRLLSVSELQAAVAHEIGHEYFWSEYGDTRLTPSAATRRTVELKCDGIAALTLLALRLDVSHLSSAMKKITQFNEGRGARTQAVAYPSVGERERFLRSLLEMTTAGRK